jgi:hypothetical protein
LSSSCSKQAGITTPADAARALMVSIVINHIRPHHGGAFQRDAMDDCEGMGLLSGGLVVLILLSNCFDKGVIPFRCG